MGADGTSGLTGYRGPTFDNPPPALEANCSNTTWIRKFTAQQQTTAERKFIINTSSLSTRLPVFDYRTKVSSIGQIGFAHVVPALSARLGSTRLFSFVRIRGLRSA